MSNLLAHSSIRSLPLLRLGLLAGAALVIAGCTKAPSEAPEDASGPTAMDEAPTRPAAPDLEDLVVAPHRSPAHVARNEYRHPVETLEFFGLEPDMTVLEALPGGLWYAEIIAPYVKDRGQYIAAGYDTSLSNSPDYQVRQQEAMVARFEAEPEIFGDAKIVTLSPPESVELGPPGSVDMVLTFRNFHGWIRGSVGGQVLTAFYEVLEPGGVLGIVQHRAGPRSNPDAFIGYLPEERVIEMAEAVGFELEARSEINANPKDTADHPAGVWTLPPSFRLGDEDREKYAAIGESDRMTLRFRKPGE